MVQVSSPSLTLEEFLQRPETKPASEYINGAIIQKPMPKGRHSRLQGKLCSTINEVTESAKIAYAFPELRCSFGDTLSGVALRHRSIVADVAIFLWDHIPFTPAGDVPDNFELPPDWTIEILSPEQRPNKVIDNILHCLKHGSQLGWFVDPGDRSLLGFKPQQQPVLCQGDQSVPILPNINLTLIADQIFGWLSMR